MRIIAGEFRGRKLLSPETTATRPITDRVKQSLFDILSPRIPDSTVYDCFAGTGSMGLECLSRGATHAVFFEIDRSAVERLQQNLQTLQVNNRSTVIATDIFKTFSAPMTLPPVDLIFLDPPYRFVIERQLPLTTLATRLAARLKSDGVIIFRHDAADTLAFPSLHKLDERTYGGMKLEFLSGRASVGNEK